MGQLAIVEFLSVDGVMQGLGSPAEDTSGGFRHGGWGTRYAASIHQVMGDGGLAATSAYLFGRKTFEKMAAFWPSQPDTDPIAAHLNRAEKIVVSRTLRDPMWRPARIVSADVDAEVRNLKASVAGDVVVLGSGELSRYLLAQGLVDELRLFLHPLLLGSGKRLFGPLPDPMHLTLESVAPTDLGTIAIRYRVGDSGS